MAKSKSVDGLWARDSRPRVEPPQQTEGCGPFGEVTVPEVLADPSRLVPPRFARCQERRVNAQERGDATAQQWRTGGMSDLEVALVLGEPRAPYRLAATWPVPGPPILVRHMNLDTY